MGYAKQFADATIRMVGVVFVYTRILPIALSLCLAIRKSENMDLLPTIDVGRVVTQPFRITKWEQMAFLELSGDTNPIHSDLKFAQASGFEKPVVYGGILIAKISGFLGTFFPGRGCIWTKLKIDFRAPLFVDDPAILRMTSTYGNPELKMWELDFLITSSSETVVATGSVQASRKGP